MMKRIYRHCCHPYPSIHWFTTRKPKKAAPLTCCKSIKNQTIYGKVYDL